MIIANQSYPMRTHGGLQRLLSLEGGGGGSVISALDFYCMKLRMPTPTYTHLRERVGVEMTALKNQFGVLLVKHKAFNFYSVTELR